MLITLSIWWGFSFQSIYRLFWGFQKKMVDISSDNFRSSFFLTISHTSLSSSQGQVLGGSALQSVKQLTIPLFERRRDLLLAIPVYLRALAGNHPRDLIPSIDLSDIAEPRTFVSGHEYRDHRRHLFTLPKLMSSTYEFSRNRQAGQYMLVSMEVLTSLDVSACEILCFGLSVISRLSPLQPKGLTFFLPKRGFSQIQSRLLVPFFLVFNFE
jgi:hypothetical protein